MSKKIQKPCFAMNMLQAWGYSWRKHWVHLMGTSLSHFTSMQLYKELLLATSHVPQHSMMCDSGCTSSSLTRNQKRASNYFNFHTFVMPRRLCYSRNCQCPLQHTELIEYSKILTIAVAETNAGNKLHTVGIVDALSNDQNAVFQFKGSYEDQELSRYKSIRFKLHLPYTIWSFSLLRLFFFLLRSQL